MCPFSIKCALSTQLTERHPSHPTGGMSGYSRWPTIYLHRGMRRTHHNSRVTEGATARYQYWTHCGYHDARRLHKRGKAVAPSFHLSLGPRIGAQYLCACPPSAIKGEACGVTERSNLRPTQTLTSSYKRSSNTSHSGVGCYAPAARTTLNPCVFLCSSHFPTNKQNALAPLHLRHVWSIHNSNANDERASNVQHNHHNS
jgi:hypothetical protein